jgi:hypothetical protein
VWFSGLILLKVAIVFLLIEFFRLMAISKKAGELADLRASRADYNMETYTQQKSEIINRKISNTYVSDLMEENENIKAL